MPHGERKEKAGNHSGCLLKFLVIIYKTCVSSVAVDFDKGVQKNFFFDWYSVFYSAVVKAVFGIFHIIAIKYIEVDTTV